LVLNSGKDEDLRMKTGNLFRSAGPANAKAFYSRIVSFGLNNFVYLSSTFRIKRFLMFLFLL